MVEILFMMVLLKLPIIYLAAVVYWAVKAEPRPYAEAFLPTDDSDPQRWLPPRPRRRGPHGSPERREARRATVRRARA